MSKDVKGGAGKKAPGSLRKGLRNLVKAKFQKKPAASEEKGEKKGFNFNKFALMAKNPKAAKLAKKIKPKEAEEKGEKEEKE